MTIFVCIIKGRVHSKIKSSENIYYTFLTITLPFIFLKKTPLTPGSISGSILTPPYCYTLTPPYCYTLPPYCYTWPPECYTLPPDCYILTNIIRYSNLEARYSKMEARYSNMEVLKYSNIEVSTLSRKCCRE